MNVGFIGLGSLGLPIADNILTSTNQLFVYNRTLSRARPLTDKGAVLMNSVRELTAACDVVFSVLSNDDAVKEVTEGPDGIAAHLREGGIHVSVSTILPATAVQLHALHNQHGSYYVSAPVMGRPEMAKARKLNFLVSGNTSVLEKINHLLTDAGAAKISPFGEQAGAANVAKLCSNFLIASAIESMAEGITLANKSGIDAGEWLNMLTSTLFNAPVYENYGALLLSERFQPAAFSMNLGLKDLKLVQEQAASVNAAMPVANTVTHQLHTAINQGMGEYDWTAVALMLK